MLFDAITALELERAGTPDLNSKPTVRQMKAVTWIAAGSWVCLCYQGRILDLLFGWMISPPYQLEAASWGF